MKYELWSKEEEKFLKENHRDYSNETLGKILGRTTGSISAKKHQLELTGWSKEGREKIKESNKRRKIIGNPDEFKDRWITLKLDLDDPVDIVKTGKRFLLLKKFFLITDYKIGEKRTKHGKHVTIKIKSKRELDDKDVVFFQLFLGSDPNRELFNYFRVKANWKPYNVLFKKKYDHKMKLLSREY